jgi:hypothetical protein
MKRLSTMRLWVLALFCVALLGLQAIELSHHHESAALEQSCSVCQVLAHQALDRVPSPTALFVAALFLLFVVIQGTRTLRVSRNDYLCYHTRAPPSAQYLRFKLRTLS